MSPFPLPPPRRALSAIFRYAIPALLALASANLSALAESQAVDVAGKPQAKLLLDAPAPEIDATTLDGKLRALSALHGDDPAHPRLIVLQFGSLTEPIFRAHVPAVEALAAKFADTVSFVILYQEEAHAADSENGIPINRDQGFAIMQPTSLAERQKLAQQAVDRLQISNQTMLVDVWNNTTSRRYGSYPNMTFIIDGKGNLVAGYPWMDTVKVQSALGLLVDGKPLPPDLKGSVKLSASAPLDFAGAAMDMTGGRGPATIAASLDKISLNDQQRQVLYPALAQFLANLQAFRQNMANVSGGPARSARGPSRSDRPGRPPQCPQVRHRRRCANLPPDAAHQRQQPQIAHQADAEPPGCRPTLRRLGTDATTTSLREPLSPYNSPYGIATFTLPSLLFIPHFPALARAAVLLQCTRLQKGSPHENHHLQSRHARRTSDSAGSGDRGKVIAVSDDLACMFTFAMPWKKRPKASSHGRARGLESTADTQTDAVLEHPARSFHPGSYRQLDASQKLRKTDGQSRKIAKPHP